MNKWDFYCWDAGSREWWGQNFWGVVDRFKQSGFVTGIGAGNPSSILTPDGSFDPLGFTEHLKAKGWLKEGCMVTNEEYAALLLAAHKDPEFPITGG